MHVKTAKLGPGVWALALLVGVPLWAQTGATLSGAVTGPAGTAVRNAVVTITNAATGHSIETRTDAAGRYTAANLAPAEYRVSVTAEGFPSKSATVTLAATGSTLDLALAASTGPSLSDLGFTPEQSRGSAEEQARLDRRSHMLRTHQRLGLITVAPLLATLITANGAAEKHGSSSSGRELHATLGSITAGMYLTTASFAIFAPKVPQTSVRGPIRLHRALAWIHGPGMILTPILGALAYQQRSRGEKVHGIAQAHGPTAIVTSAAFGLAILSVSIKF